MIDPPLPGIPDLLLAAAARLGFRIKTRSPSGEELGVFWDGRAEQPLLLVGAGGDAVAWRIDAPPAGFAPYLVSRATFDVLHGGALQRDGSILFQGKAYRVRVFFDGANLVGQAFEARVAA